MSRVLDGGTAKYRGGVRVVQRRRGTYDQSCTVQNTRCGGTQPVAAVQQTAAACLQRMKLHRHVRSAHTRHPRPPFTTTTRILVRHKLRHTIHKHTHILFHWSSGSREKLRKTHNTITIPSCLKLDRSTTGKAGIRCLVRPHWKQSCQSCKKNSGLLTELNGTAEGIFFLTTWSGFSFLENYGADRLSHHRAVQ